MTNDATRIEGAHMAGARFSYWYVLRNDGPHTFFRGEERLDEEEWRREAPLDQVWQLDRDLKDAQDLLAHSAA
jgi:hypothetical protein